MAKGTGTGTVTGRKCSNCGDNGHNSRTCNEKRRCIKLFGVEIAAVKQTSIHKSSSMGQNNNSNDGYLSEGQIRSKKHKAARQVKRGKPWTEKEHMMFLEGLNNLRRGDWRGISKNYVTSRTPVQVASHAQKYFLRHKPNHNKKRRQSLFDMPFPQSETVVNRHPHRLLHDSPVASMAALPGFSSYYKRLQTIEEVTPKKMQTLPLLQTMNHVGAPVDHPSPRSVQDDMLLADPSDSSSTESGSERHVVSRPLCLFINRKRFRTTCCEQTPMLLHQQRDHDCSPSIIK